MQDTLQKPHNIAPNPDGTKKGENVPISPGDPDDMRELTNYLQTSETFTAHLNRLADYVQTTKQHERLLRRRKTVKLRNYILGNYLGYVDDNGKWIDHSDDGDGLYYDSEIATYIDVLVASIVKSKPMNRCRAKSDSRVDMREAANVAQMLVENTLGNLGTAKKLQREVKLNLLAAGETYRYTYFNPDKPNCGFEKTVFQPEVKGRNQTTWFCAECGANGKDGDEQGDHVEQNERSEPATDPELQTSADAPQKPAIEIPMTEKTVSGDCPKCGSVGSVKSSKRSAITVNLKKGKQYKNVGDVECEFVDPLEISTLGDTDQIGNLLALQRDRMIPRCVLEETYDVENLPSTETPYHLRYKYDDQNLNSPGRQRSGEENGREFEPLHFQETWFAPAVLRYKFEQDTRLVSGKTIPKGTRLKDLYPQGLYFARTGKRKLNTYGQSIADCWTHAVNSIGEGFHGIGEWDMSAMADQLNDVSSMKMNSLMGDSTSPLIYKSKFIQGGQLKNKFGLTIPIGEEYDDDYNINNVATRLPPSPGIPEAYQLAQELQMRMTNRSGAMTSSGGGMPDIEAVAKTATAYQLWYEHTLGRRAPMLSLRSEMMVEQAYQILEQKQDYWCEAMFDFVEKETGAEAVKWFLNCNIRRDIVVETIPDSWMPQHESQRKAEFREFLEIIAPLVAAKPQIIDSILEKVGDLYRGFDLTEHMSDTVEAQLRLEKVISVAEFVEEKAEMLGLPVSIDTGMGIELNPQLILMTMTRSAEILKVVHSGDPLFGNYPLDLMLDDHDEIGKAYKSWLVTADGRRASLFVRGCINHLAGAHVKAKFAFAREMQRLSLAAEEPRIEAQSVASDSEHQQQLRQNEDTAGQQLAQNEQVHAQQLRHDGERQIQTGAIDMIGQQIAPGDGK